MIKRYYLGIDQGTTGITAILFDTNWKQMARGYQENTQIYPQDGWVEHDALELWENILTASSNAINNSDASLDEIICLGLDHEGESVVMWNSVTGLPLYNAIVWQDRRTAKYAKQLTENFGDIIREKTALFVDAYFSGTKIKWLLDHVDGARALAKQGNLLVGNMDAWVLWKMTKGKLHVTDTTTASRTMLMNIHTGTWDVDILNLLDIPISILPEICDSADVFGYTDKDSFLGIKIPISGLLVDQQAALLGQACISPGMVKSTYGTGCFMLMNTGNTPVYSSNGLVTTTAWQFNGNRTYALDGGIYIAGAATQWLRDGLKIITNVSETEKAARSIKNNGGIYFVPSFTGLAAPYWDSYARGMIIGITGATTQEHIIRATLESTAYQVKNVLDIMEKDSSVSVDVMRCDGGAAKNSFLMQFQSDILGIPLEIPEIIETTALGAAFAAAIGIGEISSINDLSAYWSLAKGYEPKMSVDQREDLLAQWHRAVERSKKWIRE